MATKIGVLLVNLGSPDDPTQSSVRRFLREFLSDRRMIDLPRFLWLPLLYGVIAPFRSKHTADIYSRVWTTEGSPLLSTTKKLAVNLQKRVDEEFKGANVEILPCMRYGAPSVQNVLLNFLQKSSPLEQRRVLVLPLYPQNTEATIASTYDAVFNVLSSAREMPELRFSNGYYADPAYIAAIATSINNFWQENGKGDKLLISFHGLPEDSIQKGDNYYFQCAETCKRIKDELKVQVRHPV
eukprot:GHVU01034821.1.p1 GENE.GHVU01034821.1~~GHVU01034821.1.p1  ORF type:complete len:240 (-),score=24.94 GHVU01034821.1:964-1683(-)